MSFPRIASAESRPTNRTSLLPQLSFLLALILMSCASEVHDEPSEGLRAWSLHRLLDDADIVAVRPDSDGDLRVKRTLANVRGIRRSAIVQTPGSEVIFRNLSLRDAPVLQTRLAVSEDSWSGGGDGVRFEVEVSTGERSEVVLQRRVDPRAEPADRGWLLEHVSLAGFSHQIVDLTLRIGAGPAGDADFDVALWGAPELVSGEARSRARPNVILVSLDTLRADFLGVYGYPRSTSPNLDRLAREGFVFEQAISQSAWTLPGHFSMLTGRYPDRRILVYDESICCVDDTAVTLAEVLRANGYPTAAFTGGGFVGYESGFAQGFDFFQPYGRRIADSLPQLSEWIERFRHAPFFLFLHGYDTHRPYDPPSEIRERFVGDKPRQCATIDFSSPAQDAAVWDACVSTADGIEYLKGLYAAMLYFADQHIGQLFTRLKELDLLDDTIVVVTSDHGEEFYEHGRTGHTMAVFQESVRVPLIFWGRGVPTAGRAQETVALVDIVPTLLDMLDLEPQLEFAGRSLVPRFDGHALAPRPIYSASSWQEGWPVASGVPHVLTSAIQIDGVKVIRNVGRAHDLVLRFSLEDDPGEQHNMSGLQTVDVEQQLERWLRDIHRPPPLCTSKAPRAETEAELRALGYLP